MPIVTGRPRGIVLGDRFFKYKRLNKRTPTTAAGLPNYVQKLEWVMYTDQAGNDQHVESVPGYTCSNGDFPALPARVPGGPTYAETVLSRPNGRNCVMRSRPAPHACDDDCTPRNFSTNPNKDIHNFIDLCETPNVGIGVFTTAALNDNTIVGLYTGHLMNQANLVQGQEKYAMTVGRLNGGPINVIIDGWATGGWTRFVNHSCVPNLKIQQSMNCGRTKVVYFRTSRPIAAGEQLFIDYGREYFRVAGPRSAIIGNGCLCGRAGCHSRVPPAGKGKGIKGKGVKGKGKGQAKGKMG